MQDLSAFVISSDEEAENASSSSPSQAPPGFNVDIVVQALKDFQNLKCFDMIRSNMFSLAGWIGVQSQINSIKDL